MATGKTLDENPHVRFDEGEVASATPRRGSLLYTERPHKKAGARATVLALLASAATVAFAATAAQPAEVAHNDWGNALVDTRICDEAVGVAAIDTLTPISFTLVVR